MPVRLPDIDQADFTAIRDQVLRAAERLVPAWQASGSSDPATALIAIYAHFMELLLARLNGVPEKNLVAFLDMLGVGRLPPGAAQVPVVFTPGPAAGASVLVPAGTQVATLQTETQPAVIYETTQPLNVVAARLTAGFTVERYDAPNNGKHRDHFGDYSAIVRGETSLPFNPFTGSQLLTHALYLGVPADLPLLIQRAGSLTIEMDAPNPSAATDPSAANKLKTQYGELGLLWQLLHNGKWEQLVDQADPTFEAELITFPFTNCKGSEPSELHGTGLQQSITGRFIRAMTTRPLPAGDNPFAKLAGITHIRLRAEATDRLLPDGLAVNLAPVDLSFRDPFLVFGPQPRRGDALYIGSREVFAQAGAHVALHFIFDTVGVPAPGALTESFKDKSAEFRLDWECLKKDGWTAIGSSSINFPFTKADPENPSKSGFEQGAVDKNELDRTEGLHKDGDIAFVVPPDIVLAEIAGVTSRWIRVRLAKGDYGRPAEFVPDPKAKPPISLVLKADTGLLQPPAIKTLKLSYNYPSEDKGSAIHPIIVTLNGPCYANRTEDKQNPKPLEQPLFVPTPETLPTFYLGFDRSLPNSAVDLLFIVPARQIVEILKPSSSSSPDEQKKTREEPELKWQYYNGQWAELPVIDETRFFTESGLVRFLAPTDMAQLAQFDSEPRFWIRVERHKGDDDYQPVLQAVYLNATIAEQASSLNQELLGSGTRQKNQRFRFHKTPVLEGQQIWVREPERPPVGELGGGEAAESAVRVTRSAAGVDEVWVRWQEVGTLQASGPRSRHYVLDRISGEVRFGDGTNGIAPPEGRDNIVARGIRTGGGTAGNQPAQALTQLKTSLPQISAVTNPLAADGGSDPESVHAVLERGPQFLRHRGRAVTAGDYEWLARQAAGTRVARAQCLPNRNRELRFEPGSITLVIVPQGPEKKLLPSPQLIREVREYLLQRALPQSAEHVLVQLNVVGPGYVPVELEAHIVPETFSQAETVRKNVLSLFDRFFHPLTGGPDGGGWSFGRDVFLSELYAALEALPGVEHVNDLRFRPGAAVVPLAKVKLEPIGSNSQPGPVAVTLVEPIPAGVTVAAAMLVWFQEGERVTITDGQNQANTTIRAISGHSLTVDPFQVPWSLGEATSVQSQFRISRAALADMKVQPGIVVTQLRLKPLVPEIAATEPARPVTATTQTVQVELGVIVPDSTSISKATIAAEGDHPFELGSRLRIPEFSLPYSGTHVVVIDPR